MDLRRRIIAGWKNGEGTWEELAERFGVGVATVDRLVARYRRTGSVEPTVQKRGPDSKVGPDDLAAIQKLIEAHPDMTLPELVEALRDTRHLTVSVSTIGRVVRERLGWTRKKRPSSRRSAPARR
jgi:transposase